VLVVKYLREPSRWSLTLLEEGRRVTRPRSMQPPDTRSRGCVPTGATRRESSTGRRHGRQASRPVVPTRRSTLSAPPADGLPRHASEGLLSGVSAGGADPKVDT
jgi:hypothetical protein